MTKQLKIFEDMGERPRGRGNGYHSNETFHDYEAFTEKFKAKKTTDDCYTPKEVYDAVLGWARENLGIPDDRPIVRPFYPGGDYLNYDYPEGCVVIDNPPFSIYAKIVRFYLAEGIDFLLFAPALSQLVYGAECCYIVTDADITYENGAVVATAFTTNLKPGCRMWVNPGLGRLVKEAQRNAKTLVQKTKYAYPDCVVTSALMQKLAKHVELQIPADDCAYTRTIGTDRLQLFGSGLILSDRAAAERAAAERTAAERTVIRKLELSPAEKRLQQSLGG